jgi:hypothetical protein
MFARLQLSRTLLTATTARRQPAALLRAAPVCAFSTKTKKSNKGGGGVFSATAGVDYAGDEAVLKKADETAAAMAAGLRALKDTIAAEQAAEMGLEPPPPLAAELTPEAAAMHRLPNVDVEVVDDAAELALPITQQERFEFMLDKILIAEVDGVGAIFPPYTHAQLREQMIRVVDGLEQRYLQLKASDYQLSRILQSCIFDVAATEHVQMEEDDRITMLCPTAPQIGEEIDLPDMPQKGKILARQINFFDSETVREVTLAIKFPSHPEPAEVSMQLTRESESLEELVEAMLRGEVPEDMPENEYAELEAMSEEGVEIEREELSR